MTGGLRCRVMAAQAGTKSCGRPVTKGWRNARFG
jgi:hypothetical protein